MKVPEYNSTVDYFQAAIAFEKRNNAKFDDSLMHQIHSRLGETKRETVEGGQRVTHVGRQLTTEEINHWWYDWVSNMIKRSRSIIAVTDMLMETKKLNTTAEESKLLYAFITVGFNDEIILSNETKFLKELPKICYKISHQAYERGAINRVEYVLEKHRSNGIHHHVHFLFTFHKKIPPSAMINKIFKVGGLQDYCNEKNFIEYKSPQKPEKGYAPYEVYYEYIRGNKTPEKLPFIEQDKVWRETNKFNHLYTVE